MIRMVKKNATCRIYSKKDIIIFVESNNVTTTKMITFIQRTIIIVLHYDNIGHFHEENCYNHDKHNK